MIPLFHEVNQQCSQLETLMGKKFQDEWATSLKADILSIKVLRIEGQIMHAFATDTEDTSKSLRVVVQPLAKALRNAVGKEAEKSTLGSLLHSRVLNVLALK